MAGHFFKVFVAKESAPVTKTTEEGNFAESSFLPFSRGLLLGIQFGLRALEISFLVRVSPSPASIQGDSDMGSLRTGKGITERDMQILRWTAP